MKKIPVILLIITLLSCSDDHSSAIVDIGQDFYILDKNGNDLLDKKMENSIDTARIKIYYLIDGNKIEYSKYLSTISSYYASYDNTKGFFIIKPEEYGRKNYYMGVILNSTPDKDNISYTFIEWDKNHTDTIRSKVSKTENSLFSRMISYNDSLWSHKGNDIVFTIIK